MSDDEVPLGMLIGGLDDARRRIETEVYEREAKRVQEPPHVGRIEGNIIAVVVEYGKTAIEICGEAGLCAADFHEDRLGWIYDAACTVNSRGAAVSMTSIIDQLSRKARLEQAGGSMAIEALVVRAEVNKAEQTMEGYFAVPSFPSDRSLESLPTHAKLVVEHAQRRRIIGGCRHAITRAFAGSGDSATILDDTLRILSKIEAGTERRLVDNRVVASELLKTLPAFGGTRTVVPTGFVDLDKVLQGGLTPGNLIIVAARPSMGKTMFVLDTCVDLCLNRGRGALFFSLEMSAEELHTRVIGTRGKANPLRMVERHQATRLSAVAAELAASRLFIDETPGLQIGQLRSTARSVVRSQKVDLIVVDYLQLLAADRQFDNKATEVGEISKALKNLARELKVPVVALSQLSRGTESRADKRPMLSDLRDSGSLEQDADIVMFLYREEYYLKHGTPGDKVGVAELSISKHRNGPTGVVKLHFGRHKDDPADAPPHFGSLARGEYDDN